MPQIKTTAWAKHETQQYMNSEEHTQQVDKEVQSGERHLLDCESNLAAGNYDNRCLRCTKIKHVISLRRKTVANGASVQEESSAKVIAQGIVQKFKLTRGEIFDREFRTEETERFYAQQRAEVIRKKRTRGKREEIEI